MTEVVPVIINVRDRLAPLRQLIAWLEDCSDVEILLVDNASTYPPLLRYLETTPHRVVHLPTNLGHRAPWLSGVVQSVGLRRRYVVTDPDVVPDEECPRDVLAHLSHVLDVYPDADVVGLGLRIDDLPASFAHREAVLTWERQFWVDELAPGIFRAEVDTTFALHREGPPRRSGLQLRTGAPYLARHVPWYADSAHPTEEELYYRAHADPSVNSWDLSTPPEWLRRAVASQEESSAPPPPPKD